MTGQCVGKCKGARGALDTPARYGRRPSGERIVACNCCGLVLRRASANDFTEAIAQGRIAPNVKPTGATLWVDDLCGYDIVSMKELVAR